LKVTHRRRSTQVSRRRIKPSAPRLVRVAVDKADTWCAGLFFFLRAHPRPGIAVPDPTSSHRTS